MADGTVSLTDGIFREDGLLSSVLSSDYEYRKPQHDMAVAVADALDSGKRMVIEAPTGVGKSFAYLIPAVIHAVGEKDKVVISTGTNTLLEQLENKDSRAVKNFLSKTLGKDVRIASIRGKGNYLCSKRCSDFLDSYAGGLVADDGMFDDLKAFRASSRYGARWELRKGASGRSAQSIGNVWEDINISESSPCAHDCPYRDSECKYYTKLVREVASADVVLTNHSLLISDAALRFADSAGGAEGDGTFRDMYVLPGYRNLIIDEAHGLSKCSESHLSTTFSVAQVEKMLKRLSGRERSLFSEIRQRDASSLADDDASRLDKEVSSFSDSLKKFMRDAGDDICSSYGGDDNPDDGIELARVKLSAATKEGMAVLGECASCLQRDFADMVRMTEANSAVYEIAAEAVGAVADAFDAFGMIMANGSVYDMPTMYCAKCVQERDGRYGGARLDVQFSAVPVFAGKFLGKLIYEHVPCVICTSATLNAGDDFGFFKRFSGLSDCEGVLGLTLPSPFDFGEMTRQICVTDMNSGFRGEGQKAELDRAASVIAGAIRASGGGALVLFSAYPDLDSVFFRVSSALKGSGIRLYRQERGVPADKVADDFRKDVDSVLFAVDSFWEGMDFPGDTLRLLIVFKAPFRPFNSPLHRAQKNELEKESRSVFMDYDVPFAAIRLRQGMGRLIRSKSDRGVILVLDGRIAGGKNYSARLFGAIFPNAAMRMTADGALAETSRFFLNRKPAADGGGS